MRCCCWVMWTVHLRVKMASSDLKHIMDINLQWWLMTCCQSIWIWCCPFPNFFVLPKLESLFCMTVLPITWGERNELILLRGVQVQNEYKQLQLGFEFGFLVLFSVPLTSTPSKYLETWKRKTYVMYHVLGRNI